MAIAIGLKTKVCRNSLHSTQPAHNFFLSSRVFIFFFLYFDPRGRPQSRPVVMTIFTQCSSVRPSVPKLQNQATITAGRDCELAEWIIDDSCLVFLYIAIDMCLNFYKSADSMQFCLKSQ